MKHPIWITPLSLCDVNRRCENSLSHHLGIEFIEVGNDFLVAKMPIDTRTVQPAQIMHGGASAALAETVGSAAANFCVDLSCFYCVGVELNINHLRAVEKGFVFATARPFHLGKKTQVWEILIRDTDENLVSVSRLTMMILEKKSP